MADAATEETFDGTGGLKIFLRSWQPTGRPRATFDSSCAPASGCRTSTCACGSG